ncbi:hypothetical protein CSPB12327_03805 [Campylobacter sp. RM12327]|uniref:Exporting protein n=1 Tax=Campylobacter sputorum subsp. sputorum TaxID=32024 RepID=A0A381DGU1_9BACT|nr:MULTISPECIES: hypothetical protein [Campylobacter]ASM34993.1 hypothetical protein CSPUT_0764 [Campylobacter sputorum aubsp. sputorum RM3237]ASM39971.1 hypothetical protein CSPB_0745 [Campylobacter sputorum]KAB0581877.1 hypothetical protein F7P64_04110 [Campylobacter sputorum subsp. sputorum]MBE7357622.1 hypothetical protein [Campylobacter sp. RM11302]MBF6669268.1 hypothetical protein [Campylobacter sp. RM12327]
MFKIFCILIIFYVNLFCASLEFAYEYKFELKKDQMARVAVRLNSEDKQREIEYFNFRWTLYDATNMIVHSWWRKYPRHMSVSLRNGLKEYDQLLFEPKENFPKDEVRLYLAFLKYEKGIATFMVYIKDEANRVEVKFIDPKKPNNTNNQG